MIRYADVLFLQLEAEDFNAFIDIFTSFFWFLLFEELLFSKATFLLQVKSFIFPLQVREQYTFQNILSAILSLSNKA